MQPLPGVLPMPLVGLYYPSRRHRKVREAAPIEPDLVIVHWSGGRKDVHALFRQLARPAVPGKKRPEESYHLGIDRLGPSAQFVDLNDASWHSGDGWIPEPDLVLRTGFVDVRTAAKAPPRLINLRSVGVCLCNRGFVREHEAPALVARGIGLYQGRHRNPASHATYFEDYPCEQIAEFTRVLRELVAAVPTLKAICGHEDVTNGYIEGRGKWAGGSKLDPGPAFPWNSIPLAELGLTRIAYDFVRQGWRAARHDDAVVS